MIDLRSKQLERISNHTNPSLKGLPIEIHPLYQGANISNIPNSICSLFGIPAPYERYLDIPIHNEQPKNVIFLLVDGLSLSRASEWIDTNIEEEKEDLLWQKISSEAVFSTLTSVVPSTTANALTSIWTGALPSEHGVIGYELFLEEYGDIYNMILQAPVSTYFKKEPGESLFEEKTFLPIPTLGKHFEQHEIQTYAFQHESISGSGLSNMLLMDTTRVAFESLEDLWKKVSRLLEENTHKKYIYIYWGDLDTLSHRKGPNSNDTEHAWIWFKYLLERFLREQIQYARNDTAFLLTSDHGQLQAEIQPKFDVKSNIDFLQLLERQPTGESRLPFLFPGKGKTEDLLAYIENQWPETYHLRKTDEVIESGLFGGEISSHLIRKRLGNLIAFPQGKAYWWWAQKENVLLGRHGGLSKDEMLTPFLYLNI